MYEPHPGSKPQSVASTYQTQRSNIGSNDLAEHPAGNAYGGNRYYKHEHGHDNAITQPTSGLTDVEVGFPPMQIVPTGDYPRQGDMDITHGRAVIGNPVREKGLPPRPPENRRRWSPKGRSAQYRADAQSRRSSNRGPGGSQGYNTY